MIVFYSAVIRDISEQGFVFYLTNMTFLYETPLMHNIF